MVIRYIVSIYSNNYIGGREKISIHGKIIKPNIMNIDMFTAMLSI